MKTAYMSSERILRLRWWSIALTFLVVALSVIGIPRLRFFNDYRLFFSDKNPQFAAFEAFQDIYGKQDSILIALAPGDGEVFTRETLTIVEKLTEKAWQTPYSSRVDSLTNFHHTYAEGDDLIVSPLVEDAHQLTHVDIERVREIAFNEPLLLNRLVSPDGHVTAINITVNPPEDSGPEEAEAVAFARQMVTDMQADHPHMAAYMSGQTMLDIAFLEAAVRDSLTLMPIMFGLIALTLLIFLRSFWGMLGTLAVVWLSAIVTAGVSGFIGIPQSTVTVIVPIIILTLGVADSIHILITFFHELQGGSGKREAIAEALRINMQPVFLTSITTVIGFLSLNFSESPPFRDMGNMVAIGVTVAYFLSVFFLPALMAVLPIHTHSRPAQETQLMDRLYRLVRRHRNRFLVGVSLLILFLGYSIGNIEFNDLFTEYFKKSVQFRSDNDFICENLTGVMALHYSVSSGEANGIYKPGYLNQLNAFAEWFSTQDDVVHVDTIGDILKRINRTLHAEDEQFYRIPKERKLVAQYMLLYELSLPYGLDLNNLIDVDRSSTRFSVILDNIKSKDIIALDAAAKAWVEAYAPELQVDEAVGPSIMFSHISERNLVSMIDGMVIALLLISGVILVSLRSIRLGIISLIPNIVPSVMAYGLWGLLVGELGMSGTFIMVIVLGIIVDNTVHFLSKYLRAKREIHSKTTDAVAYAFRTVGVALTITAVILIGGFSVMSLSSFQPSIVIGQLTAIALSFALFVTFFLLPPMLFLFDGKE
jgi:predicted RND superfamily exporter protein